MSDTSSNASKRAKAAADKATQEMEARLDALADVFSADAVEDVMDELREMVSQIKEKAGAAEKKVVQTARDNPVQTLLVAFGVGFLASLLMRR
jgi:ElaB/YqjD/DUF883 family membrane-anchored ribosome-binding protein